MQSAFFPRQPEGSRFIGHYSLTCK